VWLTAGISAPVAARRSSGYGVLDFQAFRGRAMISFQLPLADSDSFPGWPGVPPSMKRRTPYPAGWKPALSHNGRDNGLAVSKSTEIHW
jgi:hypothetical protein